MGLYKDFVSQTRKPEGFLGKVMVDGMNGGHAKMADWGMSHLESIAPSEIVELGCGGGRNAGELLKRYPAAKVTAIDYSEVSVEKARDYNPGREKDAEGLGMNESREDYIKTIYALKSRMKIVRSVDVANEMGYTRPSVSRATTTLKEKGLITMDGKKGINLTKKGLEVARMISEKHELLKDFLLQTTGTDEKAAEEEACRMEHFVSQATLDGIRDFIQKDRQDATT